MSTSPAGLSYKTVALGVLILGLAAVVAYSVVREHAPKAAPSSAGQFVAGLGMDEHHAARPMSAQEEAYAAALWPIHSEVKVAAVRMIFAGIAYKTQDHNAAALRNTVQPLAPVFKAAAQRARKLVPPASLVEEHRSYIDALDLYESAAREMIKVTDDGRDEHLVIAHERSERGSTALIKLSDTLWPGEYKPN